MIPIKVGTLSIIKCKGFSFLVHIWGNYKLMSSKFWKINKLGGRSKSGGLEKISKINNRGAIIRYS